MKRVSGVLILLVISVLASAQVNKTYQDYIQKFSKVAVKEMQIYRIPASITLAQGLLESGAGKSRLAVEANNHFGIKCHKDWTGGKIYHDDDQKGECFRVYENAEQSFEDHSQFLKRGVRYASLFELPCTDYKSWALGLKKAGYATNPIYAERLIKIIEEYKLYQYDTQSCSTEPTKGAKETKEEEPVIVANETPEVEKKSILSFFQKLFKPSPKPNAQELEKIAEENKVFDSGNAIADINPFAVHTIKQNNGVKYVVADKGDTYASIADELGLFEKELLKFNEIKTEANLQAGEYVYIEFKKKTAAVANHVLQEGETLYTLSQKYAVKVRDLYELNGIIYGTDVKVGTTIKLK